ncbi:hypothetical protein E1A91_D07G038800v1 [Gossypium mustelinum]|uniref:Uncharacterized protein n=1 Tax=Gossypium mustelinum TaxID=34275 RepID=A0A5D2U5I5_GOSMU|nr:hypothetical protein E1A91_D07G038800v1 [Gossypium mustelinum]
MKRSLRRRRSNNTNKKYLKNQEKNHRNLRLVPEAANRTVLGIKGLTTNRTQQGKEGVWLGRLKQEGLPYSQPADPPLRGSQSYSKGLEKDHRHHRGHC